MSIGNKANLLGVFDELKCNEIPLNISRMFVVFDTVFEDAFEGILSVRIVKYDRDVTIVISNPLPIHTVGRGKQPAGIPFELKDLSFPELGRYKVQLYFNDKVIHTGYLRLVN